MMITMIFMWSHLNVMKNLVGLTDDLLHFLFGPQGIIEIIAGGISLHLFWMLQCNDQSHRFKLKS